MKFAQLATIAVILASSAEAHKLSSSQSAQLKETVKEMEQM